MKKKIFIYVFLPCIAILSACNVFSGKDNRQQLILELQQVLDSIVIADSIPGSAFCVLFPDSQLISISSGYADKEKNIKMPIDPIIFSGSIGKTFVAATALKLVEDGLISLDTLVKTYFSEEQWFDSIPNSREMTIRMLMNHTSGIPDYVYKKEIWESIHQNPDKEWTGKERMMFIANDTALFKAGQGWSYADANYILLGMVIEKVSGKLLYDLCLENFIEPLRLVNTQPAISREIKGLVSGYTSYSEMMLLPTKPAEDGVYAMNPQFEWAGGGFTTNVSDLAKWAKALFGGQCLSEEMMKEMFTPVKFPTGLYEDASYGLGTFIGQTDSILYYGHTGFFPGYTSAVEYIPSLDIAIAMQSNTDHFPKGKHKVGYLNLLKALVVNKLD